MRDVTGAEVKTACLAKGIMTIDHHECGGCGHMVFYYVEGEALFFNPSCGCTAGDGPETREWDDAATWINMQLVPEVKAKLAMTFGICLYAKSDMTPCVIKDGDSAKADDGVCVGCGLEVDTKELQQTRKGTATASEMGEIEIGDCDICGKSDIQLNRKYYHYGIKCQCHGPDHFELVRHCKDCIPKPPEKTTVYLKPKEE